MQTYHIAHRCNSPVLEESTGVQADQIHIISNTSLSSVSAVSILNTLKITSEIPLISNLSSDFYIVCGPFQKGRASSASYVFCVCFAAKKQAAYSPHLLINASSPAICTCPGLGVNNGGFPCLGHTIMDAH